MGKINSSVSDKKYEKFLKKQFKEFQEKLEDYEKYTEDFADSSNFLFKTFFLDYELNQPRFLLNHVQSISLELLNFVNNVCEKHEINWWLDFGNLLGAVRHGGYIPWDDDIDIGMMREDYLTFDKIIYQEIKNQGLIDLLEVRYRPFKPGIPKFIQVFVRGEVDISNFRYILGNVDIFPYEYIKDYDENNIVEIYRNAKNNYLRLREMNFNLDYAFDKYYDDLNLSWEPTDYIIPGWESSCTPDDIYGLSIFKKDKIFPLNEINFEGHIYPCPNDVDYHLKKIYSDYMDIPKILRKHDRIGHFKYNTNNEEIFPKCLKRLKKANKNFK